MTDVNIFCFPFAGGSSYSFNSFSNIPMPGLKLVPIELPGRGRRVSELLLTDIESMADDVYKEIKKRMQSPFAFWGHSMGTLISFLVARKLIAEDLPRPRRLFVSGSGGPSHRIVETVPLYTLSDNLFISKVTEMGGIHHEIFENKEVLDFFLPILRADFQAVETYTYRPFRSLDIPITCMVGIGDKTSDNEIEAWQLESDLPIRIERFSGNHFFIFHHKERIIDLIVRTI